MPPAACSRSVPRGQKVAEGARCPVEFRGDWASVIARPEVEVVVEGMTWTEGPVWDPSDGSFYFSDTVEALICRWRRGECAPWVTHAGGYDGTNCPGHDGLHEPGSNGMALAPGGQDVLICQHATRRVVRTRLSGLQRPGAPFHTLPFSVVAEGFGGRGFNSPNDVVAAQDGAVWFTDPPYGRLRKENVCDEWRDNRCYLDEAAAQVGQPVKGVYRVHPGSGAVALASAFHRRPNGLAFSPSGAQLWVADSSVGAPSWTAYPTTDDPLRPLGKAVRVLTPATLGCRLGDTGCGLLGHEGVSDGFRVDAQGRIWSSMPNGFCVIDPEESRVVCEVLLGVNTGTGMVWRLQRKA
eukprot:TRINITY_DN37266_c0_g1_i1.p1 TRINITY_DN37266_c0_g1~~TRINITY_DN37266_c0_g1_i1.p1  ORF type:complete len:377 (+),score=85.01 TRINITY_DN37266_c0_g1_i1:77-1132(+)